MTKQCRSLRKSIYAKKMVIKELRHLLALQKKDARERCRECKKSAIVQVGELKKSLEAHRNDRQWAIEQGARAIATFREANAVVDLCDSARAARTRAEEALAKYKMHMREGNK